MKKLGFNILAVAFMALTFTIVADAQATRTWVSGVGDDVNPCSRTAPCKTFAGAISKTATNGEISCLDPAGYGAVTITKSITIDCEDTQGSILASGVNGVTINITLATDTRKAVRLRGLSINGANTGLNGIRIIRADNVFIEDTVIDGFATHGVSIETTAGNPQINIDRVSIRRIAQNGINSFISGGTSNIAISNSTIAETATGVNMSTGSKASVNDSVISNNTTGVLAASAELGVVGSTISHNTTGVSSLAGGQIRISDNFITGNGTGLSASGGGSITSFSNNVNFGNTVNGAPTAFQGLN